MAQDKQQNNWKTFHDNLDPVAAKKYKAEVERVLGISQSAFYRKIKDPDRFLSIAEKLAVAKAYHLKAVYFFPELEGEKSMSS